MQFSDLGLSEPILRSITAEGYSSPTPIQAQAIPHVLAGKDVLGCAQTGTGKTAAFALPLVQRLMSSPPTLVSSGQGQPRRPIRAVVLSPTRELALQIVQNLAVYARFSGLRFAAIFGGVNQNPQVRALKDGVDIVVATPGRLMDLMEQGYVRLDKVQTFILDEADRMLDMGFIQPIRTIAAAVPTQRQTLLFSATMPSAIKHLADALLRDPVRVQVAAQSSLPERIDHCVYHVGRNNKPQLLSHLLTREYIARAIVFTRTKHGADKLVRDLHRAGIFAEAIHGNKRQNVRQRTLANFRSGRTPVLVATDVAARGIDVDDISHVVNFDLPNEPETYVHRIGRTGRAGASGIAVSFCDHGERGDLKAIERILKKPIEVKTDHPTYTQQQSAPAHFDGPAPTHRKPRPHHHDRSSSGSPHDSRHPRPAPRAGGPRPAKRAGGPNGPRQEQAPRGPSNQSSHQSSHQGPKRPVGPLSRHKNRSSYRPNNPR